MYLIQYKLSKPSNSTGSHQWISESHIRTQWKIEKIAPKQRKSPSGVHAQNLNYHQNIFINRIGNQSSPSSRYSTLCCKTPSKLTHSSMLNNKMLNAMIIMPSSTSLVTSLSSGSNRSAVGMRSLMEMYSIMPATTPNIIA